MKDKSTHSKIRNSGILFELLTRQITLDILAGQESQAVDIFKKYFAHNTEISKEYKLYNTLTNNKMLAEGKANKLIDIVQQSAKRLDVVKLNKEKYNLIKEIKEKYDIDKFLKLTIDNYKLYASVYNIINTSDNFISPNKLYEYKEYVIENITKDGKEVDNTLDDYLKQDKETRILTYKILIENFNKEYSTLLPQQREVLKYYINYGNDNVKLKEYLSEELNNIKKQLVDLRGNITDETTGIKVDEVTNLLSSAKLNNKIKDNDVLNILQYQELIYELTTI